MLGCVASVLARLVGLSFKSWSRCRIDSYVLCVVVFRLDGMVPTM